MKYSLGDTVWFSSFKEGEEKAFDLIFKSYRKRIFNFTAAFLNDKMEAEEVTLDTFFALWKQRCTIESPEHILNWLYFDSRRRCISALRRPHLRNEEFEDDTAEIAAPEPVQNYERIHAELIALIENEVERLPEKMKDVFVLRFGKKLSPQEVATFMGIKVDTVYEYTNKAIQKLRNQLFNQWLESSILLLFFLLFN